MGTNKKGKREKEFGLLSVYGLCGLEIDIIDSHKVINQYLGFSTQLDVLVQKIFPLTIHFIHVTSHLLWVQLASFKHPNY